MSDVQVLWAYEARCDGLTYRQITIALFNIWTHELDTLVWRTVNRRFKGKMLPRIECY